MIHRISQDEVYRCTSGVEYLTEDEVNDHLFDIGMVGVYRRTPKIARLCPYCSAERFARKISRRDLSWGTWNDREELDYPTGIVRDWCPTSDDWCCILYCPTGQENYGSGKTHISVAVGKQWIENRRKAKYRNACDVVDETMASYRGGGVDPELDRYRGLLILDDLGMEDDRPSTIRIMDKIMDRRWRKRLPTLITSNLNSTELHDRYPRSFSRWKTGTMIEWWAPDYRGMM